MTSGVNVDLVVLILLVLFAVLGALSGALRQVVMLVSALLGYLTARYLAPLVAAGYTSGIGQPVARAVAGLLFFFAVMFLVSFIGKAIITRVGGGQAFHGPADRALGAFLGAAKAALGLWVVLSAFVLVGKPVGPDSFRLDPQGSDFAAIVSDFNVLDTWASPTATTLRRVLKALRDPQAKPGLTRDEDIQALMADPRLQQLLTQSQGKLGEGSLVTTPEALRLLSDPTFLKRLEKAQLKLDQIR